MERMASKKVKNAEASRFFFVLVSLAVFLCFTLPSLRADEGSSETSSEKKQTLSAGELLKSKAGQFFVARQYDEALKEFQALAKQTPDDLGIQRYIGACFFQMKRPQEALDIFNKILEMDPNDFSSRQFLAKIYLNNGEIDGAEKEFAFILENDKTGTFKTFAESQLQAIKKLREAAVSPGASGRQISPDEFLKTKAASFFASAQYKEALVELENLEKEYPRDVLIKRYKGLALDKLGRYNEAMAVYKTAVEIVPDSVAVHYFMAQTYFHLKDYEKTKTDLEFVVNNDSSGVYKIKAQADLQAVNQMITYLKKPKPKPWSASISVGQEYATNATAESRFRPFKSVSEEHTFKMPESFSFSYDLSKSGPWSTRFSYSHSGSFYWSVRHLNVLADTFSFSTTYVGKVMDKAFITQLSPAFSHVAVDRKFYSSSYPASLTFIYSYWDWHRVIFTDSFTLTDYKLEGSLPTNTSREGIGNNISVTNNFYMDKEKKKSFQIIYSLGADDTVGSLNVKDHWSIGGGFSAPLFGDTSGNIRFRFKDINFPETNAAIQRHDQEWTISGSLNIPLNDSWSWSPFYSYTNVNSKDEIFSYLNHAGGANLTYSF